MIGAPGDPERVGFEPGPHRCMECKATFQHTPWAFPLMDLRFDEELRFCSEQCLRQHETSQRRGGAT